MKNEIIVLTKKNPFQTNVGYGAKKEQKLKIFDKNKTKQAGPKNLWKINSVQKKFDAQKKMFWKK